MKNKIVSLRPHLDNPFVKAQRAFDPSGVFDINFDDMQRVQITHQDGTVHDSVVYGVQSEIQVRQLMSHFCLPRLPLLWDELMGLVGYCHMLHSLLLGPRKTSLAAEVRTAGLNVVKQYFPLDYPASEAFFDENWDALRDAHLGTDLYERVAVEYLQLRAEAEAKANAKAESAQ